MAKAHNECCRTCEETIKNLLTTIFDEVHVNCDIDLPVRVEDYTNTKTHADLKPHLRGRSGMALT
jgi:hypothetical protein